MTILNEATTIIGSVERVTYHNPENGFCVIKVAIHNQRNLVTVIGNVTQVMCGERVEATGIWINNKEFGQQLKANTITMSTPTSIEGIKKYLASGLIKGVGKHFANVLVTAFKEDVFNVLDYEPEKVKTLPGIGEKRTSQIIQAWHEQKEIRKIMVFLHQHGIGTNRAVRIYKTYKEETIDRLTKNPYCLSLDIWGIGFKTADDLAQSIGIDKNSLIRAEAGIRHVLSEYSTSGHCAITIPDLIEKSTKILLIEPAIIEQGIKNELTNGNIIKDVIGEEAHIFLSPLYYAELGITSNLLRLLKGNKDYLLHDELQLSNEKILTIAMRSLGITLSLSQKQAILMAVKNKVSIITGGPGVGKTTIVRSIITVLHILNKKITLCAPTGRAAKRLSESANLEAKTIHRLLEYKVGKGAKYNQEQPLTTDFVIIDETSMVDVSLMNTLLKAVPDNAGILFVGDIDQLPSVGPGVVLADMINSLVIPTTKLTEIFRQALSSKIITNAHRINQGQFPYFNNQKNDDFFFIELDDPEDVIIRINSIVAHKLPEIYQFNSFSDIQLLVPMNRGTLGTRNLNLVLQDCLNGKNKDVSINSMGYNYRVGDKVMQIVNNYDKEVFNGDIGFITAINLNDELISIKFDNKIVEYERSELDELDLAYAISIHKSQGSEFPVVIIPICTQHYALLERNLIYTGVTRGKKMVILIGQKKALFMAINKISSQKRITGLHHKLTNTQS